MIAMKKASLSKLACIGMIALSSIFAGCGSEHKVAVIDYQKLDQSPKIQSIQKEIRDKDKEINTRLSEDSNKGLSDEEMQKKIQSAQQERMIFIQSKQNQIKSLIESQASVIAKEKNIGIVMNKMAVPSGAIDITDEVLAKIDGGTTGADASKTK